MIKPKIASARGMNRAISSFVAIDSEGVAHQLVQWFPIGSTVAELRFLCEVEGHNNDGGALSKGAVTCMTCLSIE